MKPNFALTGDQALTLVLQTTESIDQQVLTSLGASLAVGLPGTSTSYNSTTTTGGTSPGTVATATTTKSPGVVPTVTNSLPSGASLPSATPYIGTLGLDPVLRYKAASYLFQQVQLLNQEIDNAANRSCYVPYVVMLKLTVVNYRPRLPYAVHSHIGFFYNGNPASAWSLGTAKSGLFPTPTVSGDLAAECAAGDQTAVVVPLLVADDIEVAIKSRAVEAASQIAGALSGMVSSVGVSANASAAKTSLTAIANHDLSSTLTVGRETENTLLAVIAPNNQASGQPALSQQTYDVSVLVLLPRYYFGGRRDPRSAVIGVTNFIQYRDANTGVLLPQRSGKFLARQADAIIPNHLTPAGRQVWKGLSTDQKDYEVQRLMGPVIGAEPALFGQEVSCDRKHRDSSLCDPNGALFLTEGTAQLWTELSSLVEDSVDKVSLFQAQLPSPVSVESQQVLLSDDGTHPIQAVLGNVNARSVGKIGAALKITPFDKATWKASALPVSVPAQSLTLDPVAHTLTLAFPSLKKLSIDCLSPVADPPKTADKTPQAKTSAAHVAPTPRPGPLPARRLGAAPPVKSAPKQKPAAKATADSKEAACPSRAADTGAGSEERPNGIELRLVGCDPSKQLCPEVTETVMTINDSRLRRSRLMRLKSELGDPVTVDAAEVNALSQKAENALAVAVQAVDNEEAFETALAQGVAQKDNKATLALLQAALEKAKENATAVSIAGERAVEDARSAAYASDQAVIGVSLSSIAQSTDPAKFTMADAGDAIDIEPTGTGALNIAVNGFKAPYTAISVVTTGAGLVSVAGASSGAVSFDAKNGFLLKANDNYTLNFTNLTANGVVTVKLQGLTGDKALDDPVSHTYRAVLAPTPPSKQP